MYGDSGGALVLLWIVTNFQIGACSGLIIKFAILPIFLFRKYERLFEAERLSMSSCNQRIIVIEFLIKIPVKGIHSNISASKRAAI
jgi:hypothetical protein